MILQVSLGTLSIDGSGPGLGSSFSETQGWQSLAAGDEYSGTSNHFQG